MGRRLAWRLAWRPNRTGNAEVIVLSAVLAQGLRVQVQLAMLLGHGIGLLLVLQQHLKLFRGQSTGITMHHSKPPGSTRQQHTGTIPWT